MDIKNAEMGVALEIDIFNEFFRELYTVEVFPNNLDLGNQNISGLGTKYITVQLNQPEFHLNHPQGVSAYTRLHINGTVEIRPENQPQGNIELALPLDAFVRLTFVLRPGQNNVPLLRLRYDGIDGSPSPVQVAGPLDDFMRGPDVAALLDSVNIDLFSSMVISLEGIYFPDGNAPTREDWPVQLFLYPGRDGFADALAGFVARPGQSPDPGIDSSFLPDLMGLALIFNRKLLDANLAVAAAKKVGTKQDGATITRLLFKMGDNAILVDGHAEKDGADIDFDGPVKLYLRRGTTDVGADTSEIDVDVDKPWYYYLGLVFAGILFFIPVIGWLADSFWLIPALAEGDAAADAAPGQVKGGLGRELDSQLDALASGLVFQSDVQGVTTDSTPDHLEVKDGNVTLFAQVFVSQITENLTDARYSKIQRRFIEYELESGRKFRYSELARLMHSQRIIVPGYHDVKGEFVRSNPNNTSTDNLKELYG